MSDNIRKLWRAARAGDEALVSQLINQEDWVGWNIYDSTALHEAAEEGHTPVVFRLLEAGWSLEARNNEGYTPLALAARCGHLETVKYLLLRGADIDTQNDDKWTPLHRASLKGHTEVIKTLLLCGASQEIRNHRGKTAEDEAKTDETRAVFRKFNLTRRD